MKAQPHPIASRMYFCAVAAPYTTGAVSPAECATSTKRAGKGRPDGAGRVSGFAVCGEMPCANVRSTTSDAADASEACTKLRRVSLMRGDRQGCGVAAGAL